MIPLHRNGIAHRPGADSSKPPDLAAGSGLEIMLLHADEHEGTVALRRRVVTDVLSLPNASIHVWYAASSGSNEPVDGVHSGLMNLADVTLPDNAWYYLCGPIPFVQVVRGALIERGVPPADLQYEVFGPDLWQADLD